jgi:predicted GIY-YIG superfamily endonuclease
MSDGNELYLVQSTMLKSLYKIGISKDPYARYDQLDEIGQGLERSWSNTHTLGHKWNVGKIETALHRKYHCYRLPQSEWFKLPRKDVDRLTEFLYEVEEPDYTTVDLVNFLNHNTLKQEPTNE